MNRLAHPEFLALLVVVAALAFGIARRPRRERVVYPGAGRLAGLGRSWRTRVRWVPMVARLAALSLLVVALARPQETSGRTRTTTEGIAIQIVLDRSGSMGEPIEVGGRSATKLAVVQRVLKEFVEGDGRSLKGRTGDLIGLIAFARYADTLAPLSRSHAGVVEAAGKIRLAETVGEAGTAIGEGLALAAARLKRAEEEVARSAASGGGRPDFTIKSKVVVLLTDGENNQGQVSPMEAAKLAAEWGVRVYTIGVGAGQRYVTMRGMFGEERVPVGGSDVDERTLRAIAEATGGKYFAAEDGESLKAASAEIDRLEKTRVQTDEMTEATERFEWFAKGGLGLLVLEVVLAATVLRRSP